MPLDKEPWTDGTKMPWGKHKGTQLEEVPADYLLWLSEQKWIASWPGLLAYLRKNMDIIEEQALVMEEQRGEVEGYDSWEDYRRDIRD